MTRTASPLIALILAASPALAAEPMSAEEFERYTTGKTLYYGTPGAPYGAEQYLPGRRVIWTFLDGACQEGVWYESEGLICFAYDTLPGGPQCWSFYATPGGMTALFENDPGETELIETEQGHDPLLCPGPDVGV
ncbi:hypothetical protein [Actibacterium sp. MT2.3-13A]|uniref:hypothetical protein n=1 Tax=Actibacterium sp. MT2.3-13A TaxID=2828332 RepID=UPI001BA497E1|nr:hypothetical protein [Actibacterium sp. MT2.3-13A]